MTSILPPNFIKDASDLAISTASTLTNLSADVQRFTVVNVLFSLFSGENINVQGAASYFLTRAVTPWICKVTLGACLPAPIAENKTAKLIGYTIAPVFFAAAFTRYLSSIQGEEPLSLKRIITLEFTRKLSP